MDHADATATQATERYLLGELNAEEIGAFEEHYFDCRLCAEDVRAGMAFFEGGRTLVREEPAASNVVAIAEHRRRRWGWMQVAVAAMLAYPLTIVPLLMRTAAPTQTVAAVATPRIELSPLVPLPAAAMRGSTAETIPTVTGREQLSFHVPDTGTDYESYQVRILDSADKALHTQVVTYEDARDGFALGIEGIEPGQYRVSISAGNPLEEIGQVPFIVKR